MIDIMRKDKAYEKETSCTLFLGVSPYRKYRFDRNIMIGEMNETEKEISKNNISYIDMI